MRCTREPKPACESCGLETEYLFDGFIYPNQARYKFILNEHVKLSRMGMESGICRNSAQTGVIVGFARDGVCVRVQRLSRRGQHLTQPEYWHMDYWMPRFRKIRRNKHGTYGDPIPAKVCQRCRPLSNLELKEMLEEWRTPQVSRPENSSRSLATTRRRKGTSGTT